MSEFPVRASGKLAFPIQSPNYLLGCCREARGAGCREGGRLLLYLGLTLCVLYPFQVFLAADEHLHIRI